MNCQYQVRGALLPCISIHVLFFSMAYLKFCEMYFKPMVMVDQCGDPRSGSRQTAFFRMGRASIGVAIFKTDALLIECNNAEKSRTKIY